MATKLRDHEPVPIDDFNGLWKRGHPDDTPIDHFTEANNLQHDSGGNINTRPGIGISQDVAVPLENIKRVYNYPTLTGNTLIVLTYDYGTGEGSIYHVASSTTVYGPLLTIAGMTDFAFQPYNGRAYISPFTTYDVGGLNQEKGLNGEFLYVYLGDGTAARKAAGAGGSGTLTIANGAAGFTDAGFHLFGAVFEYNSGYLSPPAALTGFTTLGNFSVSFSGIPTSGDASVLRVHLVATKAITGYNGNTEGYQYFFIPNATVNNGTTVLNNVSFFDADLLDDASHLLDDYTEIPAGAVLTLYHDRLVLCATYDDISLGLVSEVGEPEAISQIDGLIVFPPDGNPITNAQEMRDVLYVTKRSKTGAFSDNGDEPSTWPFNIIDNALGSCVHGIATVLDSGSVSVDYLLVSTFAGICIFNGRYVLPELSWKIKDFWTAIERNDFGKIQIVNSPVQEQIYIVLPDGTMLVGNYSLGMEPKKMRWEPWSFLMAVNTVAVYNIDEIIIGADLVS